MTTLQHTQFRLSPELAKKAKKKAKILGISFSGYLRQLIAKDLASKGIAA